MHALTLMLVLLGVFISGVKAVWLWRLQRRLDRLQLHRLGLPRSVDRPGRRVVVQTFEVIRRSDE